MENVSLNLNVRGMGLSATLAIKEQCRALRAANRHVYDFGLGQSPFPVPSPMVSALRLAAPQKDYLPVKGLPQLAEAVAVFHQKKDQIEAHGDRVLVGPGSKELMFLLQLCFYGELLLRTPCWVSYVPQARILGKRISLVSTTFQSGWKITPDLLESSLELMNDRTRPRLLVMNYPSNPTGHSYVADELKALAELARKYNLIVLSDEIYGQLHYRGEHVSIAKFYPERTIVSSGISKWCGAGGWRLGTFLFPKGLEWLLKAMAAVASETYTSVSAPIQFAAIEAFRSGMEIERYLCHTRRILSALARTSVATLREAGINLVDPVGSFYLFPDFTPVADQLRARGITDSVRLCRRLLDETGVAILPGEAFGRPRSELTARLAFVDFDGAKALAMSETVPLDQPLPESMLSQVCSKVLAGVNRIAEWTAATK